ncbi:MAG: hypothetical protein K0R49_742 [Burkholderiales bacterium]|nr:hypothetical protein [Burkholderiales bacterium]
MKNPPHNFFIISVITSIKRCILLYGLFTILLSCVSIVHADDKHETNLECYVKNAMLTYPGLIKMKHYQKV